MAIPILNHLDLRSVSELQNALLHKTTEASASNVEGKIIYDTGTDTIKFRNASAWISLGGDTNTWRPVTVDTDGDGSADNTLTTSETLMLKKGTNITLAESAGVVTISSTDTNTNQLTTFTLRGTTNTAATTVNQGDTITLTAGTGITTTSTSDGVITIASTITDTNTQNIFTSSWVDSSADVLLRLTKSGASSGTQDIKLVAGTNIALTPSGANMTIDATDTNTWRTVTAGGNTLSTSETLAFTAGANIAITESAGAVTITGTDTNTDTLQTTANVTSNTTQYVDFVPSASGAQTAGTNAAFTFDPDTGTLRTTNLIVSGTQTISNETVQVVENNTILFEGATADNYETKLTVADPTADRVITLPDAPGTVAVGYSTTVGGATTAEVTHSLNSKKVIVQLYDTSSFETVMADVVRTTDDTIDLTFASAPSSGDVTVLVTRVA